MRNESGQISLDFIIGFTIFLIAFIFVLSQMTGLYLNLQTKTIDLDAVAYRTSVILVEDSGYMKSQTYTGLPVTSWELLESTYNDEIIRFGLATNEFKTSEVQAKIFPNTLSLRKIVTFFDTTRFSRDDYNKKLIFGGAGESGGSRTYHYNIQLQSIDGSLNFNPPLVDTIPSDSTGAQGYFTHGNIRRVVKIIPDDYISSISTNDPYGSFIIENTYNPILPHTTNPPNLAVQYDMSQITDSLTSPYLPPTSNFPQYRIMPYIFRLDPRITPLIIKIDKLDVIASLIDNHVLLNDIEISIQTDASSPGTPVPFNTNYMKLFYTDENSPLSLPLNIDTNVNKFFRMRIDPIFFNHVINPRLTDSSIIVIKFIFEDKFLPGSPNINDGKSTFNYYNKLDSTTFFYEKYISNPPPSTSNLIPAILEVNVW